MIEKIKNYFKLAGIGIAAILIYFLLPQLEALPFAMQGIDTQTLPMIPKIIYMISFETILIAIIVFLFRNQLKKNWEDMKQNHMQYFSKYFKYWLVGLMIMMISNLLIALLTSNTVANNEQAIRDLFQVSPLYVFFSAVIFAPIVEELVFRQAIRNIIPNNIIFIITSGLVFGGLHVLTDFSSALDLLYLVPYCTPGFIFAYILSKTDNIFISMGLHFFHNGILISLQFFILLFS